MWVSRKTGRSVVASTNGAVATSQPLAAQTGISILQKGGNAVDAAIATAAAIAVVEPMSTGLGGDAFALFAPNGNADRVIALNASGRSGRRMTLEAFQKLGIEEIPLFGGMPITVPGALDGWSQLLSRYGNLELSEVLEPAILYAENGFPVSEVIACQWSQAVPRLKRTPEATTTFLVDGKAPIFGEIFKQPRMANTLRLIAQEGPEIFYEGIIGEEIATTVEKYGGFIESEDLAAYLGEASWETPISTDYRGYSIFECGPNGQGIAALIGLNILENYELSEWGSFQTLHAQIEAVKLSYADLHSYIADPTKIFVPTKALLEKNYAKSRSKLISFDKSLDNPGSGSLSLGEDTIYLAVVDRDLNAVSFIQSLYYGFGSAIVAGDTGIALQNRGALFSLKPDHPNVVAPGKRPFHTIIPGMMARDHEITLAFGIMGGDHQALAHLQAASNIIDFDFNVQEALEAPRFHYSYSDGITSLEHGFPQEAISKLDGVGQRIEAIANRRFGGGQMIAIDHKRNVLLAGSDPRKDGCAIGY
ncbi:MAG: gamma-glutamyltransferase [Candidatus Thorarchaeota archaeon]